MKVGGFRVELGEIEELLASDGAVDAAAAAAAGGALAAYVVRTAGSSAEGEAALLGRLRALCAARLPSYMVPRHLAIVDAVPLSPNGKVDRSRLPAPATAPAARRPPPPPPTARC